jgi:hypothetical protein
VNQQYRTEDGSIARAHEDKESMATAASSTLKQELLAYKKCGSGVYQLLDRAI